jgi:actin-related protein
MNEITEESIVVISADTTGVRAGIGGEPQPRVVLPTPPGAIDESGEIRDYAWMKTTIAGIFKALDVDPEEHAALMTFAVTQEKLSIEMLARWMFGELNVAGLAIAFDSALIVSAQKNGSNGVAVHFSASRIRSTCVLENRQAAYLATLSETLDPANVASAIDISIQRAGPSERTLLSRQIVFSGNVPSGIERDIQKALLDLAPADVVVNVISSEQPQLAVWRAASDYAATPTFNRRVLSRSDNEQDVSMLHERSAV